MAGTAHWLDVNLSVYLDFRVLDPDCQDGSQPQELL